MRGNLARASVAAVCALTLALVGCSGGPSPTEATSDTQATEEATATQDASAQVDSATDDQTPASDNHNDYFVGRWDLYATKDATHEQIVEVMEQYQTDDEVRQKMNEAYGRDNVDFYAQFNADGTGQYDTGLEIVAFTWEATGEGAVTFTSLNGKETALHLPVADGMFTLNDDTYAKAQATE